VLKDNLIRERKLKNFTQDDVANYLKIKRQTYSAYERGVSTPDAFTLQKIAGYLNVSVDYLLGHGEKSPLDEQLKNVDFALYGEVKDLTEEDKEDVLEFIRFKKSLRDKK
jgi:transcriptional regulator with XRE-family HTH domain